MVEVHLYGGLRRLAPQAATGAPSVVVVRLPAGEESLANVLVAAGVPPAEVGNAFVNGRLADLGAAVQDGDRIGVFPINMALLYI